MQQRSPIAYWKWRIREQIPYSRLKAVEENVCFKSVESDIPLRLPRKETVNEDCHTTKKKLWCIENMSGFLFPYMSRLRDDYRGRISHRKHESLP